MSKYFNFLVVKTNVFLVFFLFALILNAQQPTCPFGVVNCQRPCGRYTDNNGDGICDFDSYFHKKDTVANPKKDVQTNPINQKDTVVEKEIIKNTPNNTNVSLNEKNSNTENKQITNNKTESINSSNSEIEVANDDIDDELDLTKNIKAPVKQKVRYNIVLWSSLTFGLYFLSLLFMKLSFYSKKIHRRIWNILLLITFLVSGILGLVLVLQINYAILPSYYFTFLKLHVDFGIGMALISIFHIFWHLNYFKNIFVKKSNN